MNEQLLAIILFVTVALGILYLCYLAFGAIRTFRQRRQLSPRVPKSITQYVEIARQDVQVSFPKRESEGTPKSFGVYLGSFQTPPSIHQARLLRRWDIIVLDPYQDGVLDVLSCSPRFKPAQVLGRIDVELAANRSSTESEGDDETIKSLKAVVHSITTRFGTSRGLDSPFTGVLLANWQFLQPAVSNCLIQFLETIGLDVYLEVPGPDYLSSNECRTINLEIVKGLVCCNGTILPTGDRRDYFQMANLRRTLRALAAQSQMTDGHVLMWNTIDDDAYLDHGVVKRSYNWCRYYSALSWTGHRAALMDAETAFCRTVPGEPLGALAFIKDDQIVKLQETWRLNDKISQQNHDNHAIYKSLEPFVPNIAAILSLSEQRLPSVYSSSAGTVNRFEWPKRADQPLTDPFSSSAHGHAYTGLGCFQLGLDCSNNDFSELVAAQRRLKDLDLLKRVEPNILVSVSKALSRLVRQESSLKEIAGMRHAIHDLVQLLASSRDEESDHLKIYMGLQSGFRTSLGNQFWGLYDFDRYMGELDMYISLKTTDIAGTVLHTFLSSRQFTRAQCLKAEIALSQANGSTSKTWDLPQRFVSDIEGLTPTEAILLTHRTLTAPCADCPALAAKVRACCEHQLIEVPSLGQLRELTSTAYLNGKLSAEQLIRSRLEWYIEQGCPVPDAAAAISVFQEVDARLPDVLFGQQSEILSQIQQVLEQVLQPGHIDATTDLFCLSLFCALRKLAVTEIYFEVLDRNPLPNSHPDQAACFAEMFALGSRCEAYFDMTPSAFGRMLADRYNAYFKEHQPPMRNDNNKELPTAYASKQVDLNPNAAEEKLSILYQGTFLGIFAFPALLDIMLLTTVGRGLYLSSYMTQDEKTMATTALMVSLFLTGAIGTWIGSGGSYYLHCMAFPAMNMFVLTRWIGGVAVCIAGGVIGFVIIAPVKGPYPAMIFSLYLVILTTYLSTLATLAIYQLPGFSFQSGRSMVMACIPILFISPIITLWTGNDIIVYLCVLTGFLFTLLVGAAKIVSEWSTWYLDIPFVTDSEVVEWYVSTKMSDESGLSPDIADIKTTPLPRRALMDEVERERNRSFWTKATTDEFVLKVAGGYAATTFLMSWYCKYSRTEMPFPYSTTWNLQCKAAIDTLKSMQKGLKFHNAFVHWRHGGDEVYCGVLYFVIALMDKWVALITGGSIVGLSAADSAEFRLSIGFALAYYLVSAIFLDAIATPLWPHANKIAPIPVQSLEGLRDVAKLNSQTRRKLYWSNLIKFFFLHAWALSVASALMWAYDNNESSLIMFLAYMGSYIGLLLYQFNRIFTGTLALPDLLVAATLGLVTGPILRHYLPGFAYGSVVALGVSTWTAALLSMLTAKVGWHKVPKTKSETKTEKPTFYSSNALGNQVVHSQTILSDIFDSVQALPSDACFQLDPTTHPGLEVMTYLTPEKHSFQPDLLRAAFPSAETLKQQIADLWQRGETRVELVPARQLFPHQQKMSYISRIANGKLHVYILLGLDLIQEEWTIDIHRNCRVIAETILQATAESQLGLSHDHSALTRLLVTGNTVNGELNLPESIKRHLETFPEDCLLFDDNADRKVLEHLLLDIDCDRDWDQLPGHVRVFLLQRCRGESYEISDEQIDWICSRFRDDRSVQVSEYLHRCNLSATLTQLIVSHMQTMDPYLAYRKAYNSSYSNRRLSMAEDQALETSLLSEPQQKYQHVTRMIPSPFRRLLQGVRVAMKFFIVSLVADPEFQRELDYVLSNKSCMIRWPAVILLNGTWLFCKFLHDAILPVVLIRGRPHFLKLHQSMKGVRTTMEKRRAVIEGAAGDSTCFFSSLDDGESEMRQYSGLHVKEPDNKQNLIAVNTYTAHLVLSQRKEYKHGAIVREYVYDYLPGGSGPETQVPITRKCTQGDPFQELVDYDERGYIKSGSYIKDGNLTEFIYYYRDNAKFDDELLRAEYFLAHMTIKVSWCVPSHKHPKNANKAIPNPRVVEATFIEEAKVYHSRWSYDHKSHPVITTTLNGEEVETPPMIVYDWIKVLKKPTGCSFLSENPLFSFDSTSPSILSRVLGTNTRYYPISTSRARDQLWKSWKDSKDFDAVTARWLDEWTLRSDRVLKPYWNARDLGRLTVAEHYLDKQADTVMARVDVDPEISSWTPIAYKTSDLSAFGQGGDTVINTRTISTQGRDTRNTLHAIAMDTGTWPNEGGGVSACRRDMVNDLRTVRWHVVAECANDYGFPKFQTERNVESLTVLPLWGLDYLTPSHGIFKNILDSQVQEKSHNTSDHDIKTKFVPILTTLVRCARALKLDHSHIEEATTALLDLNRYFESSRHWSDIWMSDVVKDAWRELWLTEDMENARPISQWLNAEQPTLMHLDNALDMWQRYLFIFSLPVPEKIPDVFQASHHFAGASYGVICKIKRGCAFHVWDHCISWREVTVFLSSAMSFDPPFVCSSLISLSRILSVLTLHHADVVLPCADFFNPGWEVELGSLEGTICHRKTYARKIDPVVNGICNMDSFQPIETITSEKPTAVMLSHVRFVKDIKNAILAADIIINEWNIKDYRLDIYGDMEKAPSYATECQEIIAAKGLRETVTLRGLGSPSKVLKQAWLFLNSSISEGLPLAMGEAALSGVPVVCTDVGASFRVVTDPETGKAFSAVCPPNDAYSLAKAQVSIMGLLGEWSEYADDPEGFSPPELPLKPTAEQSASISQRMYEKVDQRRRLGMRGRANVLSSFSSERYLREHEQMLWLAKHQSRNFRNGNDLRSSATSSGGMYQLKSAQSSLIWSLK